MTGKNLQKYFEILELNPEASLPEIRDTYLRLKTLYSTNSMVISALGDEIPLKKRRKILKQIEEAYKKIMESTNYEAEKSINFQKTSIPESDPEGKREKNISFSGAALRQIREKLGIHLYEISLKTKMRMEHLENIELENFEALPSEMYLKSQIKSYAICLCLKPDEVIEDYLKRYKEWKREIKAKEK